MSDHPPPINLKRLAGAVLFGLAVYWIVPRPGNVDIEGWRLLGVFCFAIAGLVLRPLPGGAVLFLAIIATACTGALSLEQALSSYATPSVWLVVGALMIAHVLIKTSLAKRVALLFVRHFGANSNGIAYALIFSDVTLATMIPSNTSRAGGVIMPITRSLAELYESYPGKSAQLLGTFLMVAVYQGEIAATAMFLTGQAGNFVAVDVVSTLVGYDLSWGLWAAAGIVPGLVSIVGMVWIVSKILPPKIRHTPRAREFASEELQKLGPMGREQWLTIVIVSVVCSLWITSNLHAVPVALAAMAGSGVLVLCGVLQWEDAMKQHAIWDILFWFGGVVTLGRELSAAGVPTAFADGIQAMIGDMNWLPMLVIALLIYFFAHYGLASITMHMLTLLPPFLLLLLNNDAPVGLTIFLFVCLANLSAGLTHYGTVPSPIFFSQGYASFKQWWWTGFLIGLWNLLVWCSVGSLWWKMIGIW